MNITLTPLPGQELEGGSIMYMNATIYHVLDDPLDAYNLVITFSELHPFVTAFENFTAYFSNGTTAILGKLVDRKYTI